MDERAFEDALQQCLEGTADEATESQVIKAAQEKPEFREALLDNAAFDAVMLAQGFDKEEFASDFAQKITNSSGTEAFASLRNRIRRQKKKSVVVRWAAPLAIAASLLLVLGIGLRHLSRESTPQIIARISTLEGNASAYIEHGGKSLPATNGVSVRLGDSVYVKGSGHIVLKDESRDFRMTLNRNGRFTVKKANRFYLESGRLEAHLAEHLTGGDSIIIETAMAEARIVGTKLIMFADPSSSRLRVKEGHVRFGAKNRNEVIDVRTGECAMIHNNRKQMLKMDYEPNMTIEGDTLFRDNFETGISKWNAALVDEDGNISTYPGDISTLATWKQVRRGGQTIGCMEMKVAEERPEGQPSLIPGNFSLPDRGFLLTLDVYYPQDASLSVMSMYYKENTETFYNRPNQERLFGKLLRKKRWGHEKVVYVPEHDADGSTTHRTKFYLDDKLLLDHAIQQSSPPLLALKCRRGKIRITDLTVKELLIFD